MDTFIVSLGWVGMFAPLALGAVGSAIGCARAGMAACGALLDVESGYGRYIGVAAMPSSQTIYGIVVTMALRRELTIDNSPGIFGIGILTGLALMISAFAQGECLRCGHQCLEKQIGNFRHFPGAGGLGRRFFGVRICICAGAFRRHSQIS